MSDLSDQFHEAPFIRIFLSFASGIIIAEWLSLPGSPVFLIIPALLLLLVLFRRDSYRKEIFTGSLIFFLFLSLGFSLALAKRYSPINLPEGRYFAILDEYPVEKGKSLRAVIKIVDPPIKALAYFVKSDTLLNAKPGMPFYFTGRPQLIRSLGNPWEFNYEKYSRRNNIGHRIFLRNERIHFLNLPRVKNLRYEALILREKLLASLQKSGVTGEPFKVISAITLGSRDNLDPEITRSFTRTGTLHILAVSGGNVAVIYFILVLLFGFLKRPKTILLFTVLILSGIWMYALVTGFSPSILRASLMFSFIVIGKNLRRDPNIYNSLAASAFTLLLFKPSLLFDAGFQLSYAAVFSIVFLQPIIFRQLCFKFKIPEKIWMLFTVCLAAQIGTLPLSLWYFHQFPVYFWLSNLVVVPLLSLFLYLSFFIILSFQFIPLLGTLTAELLTLTGNFLLKFLNIVENLPFAVIENIYPTSLQLLLIVLVILLALLYWAYSKPILAFFSLSALLLFLILSTHILWQNNSRNEIVIFNSPGRVLLAFTKGHQTLWLSDETNFQSPAMVYLIKPYEGFRQITHSKYFSLNSLEGKKMHFEGLTLLFSLVKKEGQGQELSNQPNTIIVANSASWGGTSEPNLMNAPCLFVKIEAPLHYFYTKSSSLKELSFSEEKALKITVHQKNDGNVLFKLNTW